MLAPLPLPIPISVSTSSKPDRLGYLLLKLASQSSPFGIAASTGVGSGFPAGTTGFAGDMIGASNWPPVLRAFGFGGALGLEPVLSAAAGTEVDMGAEDADSGPGFWGCNCLDMPYAKSAGGAPAGLATGFLEIIGALGFGSSKGLAGKAFDDSVNLP